MDKRIGSKPAEVPVKLQSDPPRIQDHFHLNINQVEVGTMV